MSEKTNRISVMQRTLNWASEIELIAGSLLPGDTRESWLARAARKSGASFRQIKALYYREINDPKFSVAAKIMSAADQARIDGARRDAAKLANTYQSTAHALGNIDADFHRGNIDALVSAARILGSLDSTGTESKLAPEVHIGFDPPTTD